MVVLGRGDICIVRYFFFMYRKVLFSYFGLLGFLGKGMIGDLVLGEGRRGRV